MISAGPPPDCPIPGARGYCEPEGTGSSGVLILGEALGDAEAEDGLPFRPYAQAGSVLERAIRRSGYTREMFVLWNVVPVQPPKNWLEGAPWEHEAVAWGRPLLKQVIDAYKPRCIMALGNVAVRAATSLAGDCLSISYIRGYALRACGDLGSLSVVGSFHPSFLRRGAMHLLPVLMHDLKLAVASAAGGRSVFHSPVLRRDVLHDATRELADPFNPRIPPGYITHPSEADAWEFARAVQDNPSQLLAYDIETPRSKRSSEDETDELGESTITSIQFSLGPETGIFMPWREPYIAPAQRVLAGGNPKAGANTWRFDDPLLHAHGCQIGGVRHDLRWAWKHLNPDLPAGLQFIASFFCSELGPWKHLHSSHKEFYGIRDVDSVMRIV